MKKGLHLEVSDERTKKRLESDRLRHFCGDRDFGDQLCEVLSMKAFLMALAAVCSFQASAEPFVCFTGLKQTDAATIEPAEFSCQAMNHLGTGLNAVSITMLGVGVYAACTGLGA